MKTHIQKFVTLCALSLCALSGASWNVAFKGKCPASDPSITWYDHIKGGNWFGVQFRYAKALGDPAAYGNLRTDACYTVCYLLKTAPPSFPKTGFYTNRVFRKGGKGPDKMDGQPGDPTKWVINVYGKIFLFNNDGEVIDDRGRTVGVLVCYGSNECDQF